MSRYRDQVTAAVSAVAIRGLTGYAWLGRSIRRLPASLVGEMSGLERRRHLLACLREELYASFYCTGGPVSARWGRSEPVAADPHLATALSTANGGHGSWEPGWIVRSCNGDEAVVATPRLRVRVREADCRAHDGGAIRPGVAVSVRLPKELPAVSPGFFTVVGEAVFEDLSSTGLVRTYWHIDPAGAASLVRSLTTRLNAEGIPFRLKLADHPVRFDRCDAAVLYLPVDTFWRLRPTLLEVAGRLTDQIRPQIPAFTLPLAPGVGLAESADAGESFGVRRCELVADGIVQAADEGIAATSARVAAVIGHFTANGVEIDVPYLEPLLDGRHVL